MYKPDNNSPDRMNPRKAPGTTPTSGGYKPPCTNRKENITMDKLNDTTPDRMNPCKAPDTTPSSGGYKPPCTDQLPMNKPDGPITRKDTTDSTTSSGGSHGKSSNTLGDLFSRRKKPSYRFVRKSKDSIPEGWYDDISIDRIEESTTNAGEPSCDVSYTLSSKGRKRYYMKCRYPLSGGDLQELLEDILEAAGVPYDADYSQLSGYVFSGMLEYNAAEFAEISLG